MKHLHPATRSRGARQTSEQTDLETFRPSGTRVGELSGVTTHDMLERSRDDVISGGVGMEVASRAVPRPGADASGGFGEVGVPEGSCDVRDRYACVGVRTARMRLNASMRRHGPLRPGFEAQSPAMTS